MLAFLTTFFLAAAGSLVRSSVHLALKHAAGKTQGDIFALHPGRTESTVSGPPVDPILKFGCILACYGAIGLALVSALPGALAVERTMLAFACMCVGGLIGEIASTGTTTTQLPSLDVDADADAPKPRRRPAPGLSLALTMTLNLAFAVLSCGQGLIEVVPPLGAGSAGRGSELAPIVVIARRSHDPLGEQTATL